MFFGMPHADLSWARIGGDVETCCFTKLMPPALQEAGREQQCLLHNRGQFAKALGSASCLEVDVITGSKE